MTGKHTGPRASRKADLERSLRLSTAEGLVSAPICTLALSGNLFLTALVTEAFPISKQAVGLISALPFVANFLQVFLMPTLARARHPKLVSIASATVHWATWIVLVFALPRLPDDDPDRAGRWLTGWFLISSLFAALMAVGWNSWVQEWVPSRVRGKYFGSRNRLVQFSTTAFLLVAGAVIAHWHYSIRSFQAVAVGVIACRILSLYWQAISPTHALRKVAHASAPFREQLTTLLGSRSLLAFAAFGCLWSFAANCFGPFYQVFMFEQAHFSALQVGLTATLSQLGGAMSLPAWGRLLDRHGNKSVMAVSLILWQAANVAWCFVGARDQTLIYVLWLWGGATSAGFILGQFTLLLRILPAKAKDLCIAFNLSVTSIFAAAAPILGGAFLQHALGHGANALAVYHRCFILEPALALAGALLLLRVHEPAASPFRVVMGAMRNARMLAGVLGLDFLVNYQFQRPARRPAASHSRS